jgi:hypothetical protein
MAGGGGEGEEFMSCLLSAASRRGLTRNSVVTGQSCGPKFRGWGKGQFQLGWLIVEMMWSPKSIFPHGVNFACFLLEKWGRGGWEGMAGGAVYLKCWTCSQEGSSGGHRFSLNSQPVSRYRKISCIFLHHLLCLPLNKKPVIVFSC